MYTPDLPEFMQRAQHGNLVPVYREIVADLETPISAFLKLRQSNGDYAFLLESVTGGETIARYSYLATGPYRLLRSKGAGSPRLRSRRAGGARGDWRARSLHRHH